MPKEIERKFLVSSHAYKENARVLHIRQGFITSEKESIVRVRIQDDTAFLTVKNSGVGITRNEFEYEIPLPDAEVLFKEFCGGMTIEKQRYITEHSGKIWEVDEFHGDNEGLVIAEVELQAEDEKISLPPWIGKEVTGDPKYYNSSLITNPYLSWG